MLRRDDFGARAKEVLIATLLEVRAHSNEILGAANRYLFDQPPSDALEINRLDELWPYQKIRLDCRAFVEAVAAIVPAPLLGSSRAHVTARRAAGSRGRARRGRSA